MASKRSYRSFCGLTTNYLVPSVFVCWTPNHLSNPFLQDDGPALELTPELEKAREEFRINQLLPAMAPLLDSEKEPWSTWVDRLNLIGPVPEEEVTQVSNVGRALPWCASFLDKWPLLEGGQSVEKGSRHCKNASHVLRSRVFSLGRCGKTR